jgi:hypothetical protein
MREHALREDFGERGEGQGINVNENEEDQRIITSAFRASPKIPLENSSSR